MKIFTCVLKTRGEMERTIANDQLGWWHDCIPGQVLELREATDQDIARSWIRKGASTKAADYLVHASGCLVNKKAIKQMKEIGDD